MFLKHWSPPYLSIRLCYMCPWRWVLASCQVSLNSIQQFQRRSRKCEKLTTDRRRKDDGQRMITIVHLSLQHRCTKKWHTCCPIIGDEPYIDLKLKVEVKYWGVQRCYALNNITILKWHKSDILCTMILIFLYMYIFIPRILRYHLINGMCP